MDMENNREEHLRWKTLVFDLDGTLLDTIDDLKNSVNHALRSAGLPERSRDEVLLFVGNGIKNLIHRAVPEGTDEALEAKVFSLFKEHYLVHCEDMTAPYPGIMELLGKLKDSGAKCAIVSNKNDVPVKKLSEKYFGDLIDIAIGENEAAGIAKKPAPDTVYEALKQLEAKPEEAVYIGDSEVDYATAKNAGLPVILVGWGFRKKEALLAMEPDYFAEDPASLEHIMLISTQS